MINILFVGDLHIKKGNIEETRPLLEKILRLSREHDAVVLAGDIYNDHGISHAAVQELVHGFFTDLSALGKPTFNIRGNHDETTDGMHSSLTVHSGIPNVTQIKDPTIIAPGIAAIPYIRNKEQLKAAVIQMSTQAKVIFCHADFFGAKYESGTPCKDGLTEADMPEGVFFISGHFHTNQTLGRFWYPGTPRWLTRDDAGQDKGLWTISLDTKNNKMTTAFHSSSDVSPVFHKITIESKDTPLPEVKKIDKIYVEYKMQDDSMLAVLQGKYKDNMILRREPKVLKSTAVSEAKGVSKSLEDYIQSIDTGRWNKDTIHAEISKRIFSNVSNG